MLIALLAVLGVDLIVLVAFAAVVLSRKRWVKRQPGAFHAEFLLGPYRKPAEVAAAGSGRR